MPEMPCKPQNYAANIIYVCMFVGIAIYGGSIPQNDKFYIL